MHPQEEGTSWKCHTQLKVHRHPLPLNNADNTRGAKLHKLLEKRIKKIQNTALLMLSAALTCFLNTLLL